MTLNCDLLRQKSERISNIILFKVKTKLKDITSDMELDSHGMFDRKDVNPGRGYRLCSFMTQTVFERTQGVWCVQTYTGEEFF